MSGNAANKTLKPARKEAKRKPDVRVRRTRDSLGDALVELMHERPFEEITVQDVLDRAGVSRSTFYTHYRDKDDLFLSDVEDFLEMMANLLSRSKEQSHRVAPVRELFSHVSDWRKFHGALVESGKINDFLQLAQGVFAEGIEKRLSELENSRNPELKVERVATAQMLAGAMLSLMSWWLDHGMPNTPAEMDEKFHRLVLPKRA
jgi:AcrR family transcriptional regulator